MLIQIGVFDCRINSLLSKKCSKYACRATNRSKDNKDIIN